MGPKLVLVFLAVFALAIVQAILRRKLNPYRDVTLDELPDELRAEIERVLPGFSHRRSRITKRGDEARVEGDYQGERVFVEAEFDRAGAMKEFEVNGPRGARARGFASVEDLPEPASREIERVLGDAHLHFQRSLLTGGTTGGVHHYEVKGAAGEWTWEIAVSAGGRLIEVEKERRPGR